MSTTTKGVMHVYKLDTGNRQSNPHHHPSTPPPTNTTAKKPHSWTFGSLLRRSKSHRQYNPNPNFNKQDTKEIPVDQEQTQSRIPIPATDGGGTVISMAAIKDGRKSASAVEEGRKGGVWGVGEGRRSTENRAEMVMINVGEVAELYKVRVLETDMPPFMQVHVFRCARRMFDCLEESSPKQMAFHIKKDFDKVYGPAWHCIVGSSFGSFVTHATGCFIYFTMKNLHFLVFKTKVQKNVNKLY